MGKEQFSKMVVQISFLITKRRLRFAFRRTEKRRVSQRLRQASVQSVTWHKHKIASPWNISSPNVWYNCRKHHHCLVIKRRRRRWWSKQTVPLLSKKKKKNKKVILKEGGSICVLRGVNKFLWDESLATTITQRQQLSKKHYICECGASYLN